MSRTEIDKDLQDLQQKYKDDAYKSELVSQLIDMLYSAKTLLGSRDPSYTILDIEFHPKGPKIYYPIKNRPKNHHQAQRTG